MNKDQLMDLKNEYEAVCMSDVQLHQLQKKLYETKQKKQGSIGKHRWIPAAAGVVAAALALCILPNCSEVMAKKLGNVPGIGGFFRLVTIREYAYHDGMQEAEVHVEGITADDGSVQGEQAIEAQKEGAGVVNEDMEALTEKWIGKFKKQLKKNGYHGLTVSSEVVCSTGDYFTIKLTAEESQADTYVENHFYTIDLRTGKRMALKDLFDKDSDYVGQISTNIKEQMREQMAENEDISYWLDDKEMPENDFDRISEDEEFYIDDENNLVICFQEGDVAPMYMGSVTFTIPKDVLQDIRVR